MNRLIAVSLTLAVSSAVLLIAACAWASELPAPLRMDTSDFPDPAQCEVGTRDWLKVTEALTYRPLVYEQMMERCPHSFDVLNYNVILRINTDTEIIYGNTRVTSVSQTAGLSSISLDFTVLTVDSVLSGEAAVGYTYSDPVLTVDLGQAYAAGDTFDVRVVYHGHPGNEGAGGFGGFWFDGAPTMAFQMGVGLNADPPSMGKYWIPCYDSPCDKATADYRVTVGGSGKKIVCNGVLVETIIDTVGNTATYVWSETYQIPPHLMTVHARKYTEMVDSTYDWIHYWVYPTDVATAGIHFQNVDIMMDAFLDRYGSYPFSKFGYVAATKGDMEHQTCITHSAMTIQPNHNYDWLLAHEMAHQWWGDCVSVNDWRDVWLSEGFATYSEAIFHEYAYGPETYRTYMQSSLMNPVLNSPENFPIYNPNFLWGTTTYEKGGCVLHMLRHVIGDSLFFDVLATYRQAYEYSSALTTEFQEIAETVSGQDLDWFFNQWIYDVGWPVYQYSWRTLEQGEVYALNLVIDQVQTNGPVFAMPMDVKITTAAGDTTVYVVVDEASEVFDFAVNDEPTGVVLDPDKWILKETEEVAHAGVADGGRDVAGQPDLRLEQNVPNPFGPSTTIRFSVPSAQDVRLEIYNAAGQRVACLADGAVPSGWSTANWNAKDDRGNKVAPGTYFCRLSTGNGSPVTRMIVVR